MTHLLSRHYPAPKDAGGGDRTRTCTGLPLNGFLDRGSTNYAYSSICGQYLLCASPCPGLPVFCHGPAALPCRVANEDAIFTYWNRDIPGWVLSRPRSPTQAYDLFFSIFLILYYISLINLYFVYFGGDGWIRTNGPRRVGSLAGSWFKPLTHISM